MSEKESSLRSQGGAGAYDSQNNGRLKSMSADELLLEFEAKLDEMTDLDYDGELIDAYLAALDEKAPLDSDLDAGASWNEFRTKHANLFKKDVTDANGSAAERSRKARPRRLVPKVLAIAALITLFSTLCVQAADFNLFGVFGKWTEEIFSFLSTGGGLNAESSVSEATDSNSEAYLQLKVALKNSGIAEDLAPTWYPEGFEAKPPEIQNSNAWDIISCYFSGESDKYFGIKITRYNDPSKMAILSFEKDELAIEEYTSGGRLFYIMSNLDSVSAIWSDGEALTMNIFGAISTDEIKAIIDSIGG